MRVFLSWSDSRSQLIAEALRGWLPKVLQSVKPWMSDEDINAGAQWLSEVSQSLDDCAIGIICVTPENQHNPWLQFEAGALSKTLDQTCVCPVVFDMTLGQLSGPLTQFQANELTKQGLFKILSTLNKKLPDPMEQSGLEEILDVWWDRLKAKLDQIPNPESAPNVRTVNDQLDELLELSREQIRRENLRLERSLKAESKMERMISHVEEANSYLMSSKAKLEESLPDSFSKIAAIISKDSANPEEANLASKLIPEIMSGRAPELPDGSKLEDLVGELKELSLEQQNHVEEILNPQTDK
ncbi:hypothetical protein CWC31_02540 [Pseudoalteromonas ruthenica]|uniref:toll/interleukin-1 receptor domain-containing protein n=1 Tax=Pseudoalteromonas ruthenica TaxID=151081 RepID=UPI001107B65E|nr:TIR domain-containing protein [Pseudoalteromonas ruthenica]TLX52047.1 hypothetical protein CWC31_02540 [Pseudoalteromonas ruthenica]